MQFMLQCIEMATSFFVSPECFQKKHFIVFIAMILDQSPRERELSSWNITAKGIGPKHLKDKRKYI